MEIVALDVALLVGALAAVRWASKAYTRFAPLTAALVAGATFVLVRDHYDLEDSAFFRTLGVFCAIAAAITLASCLALGRGRRTSAEHATVAAVLVPVLFGASLAVRYGLCLVTHCDQS
jgi:drug/metabolite transporter (DMT)-like permease